MARNEVTLGNIAGFVEQVTAEGATQIIDYKKVFGPIFEEYMRENAWMSLMDWTYGDEERVVDKIEFSAIRETMADFDPTTKASGATAIPEHVRIKLTETKEFGARWYDRDFQLSNGLETVGNRIVAHLFRAPESRMDIAISNHFQTALEANTNVPAVELDVETLVADLNKENGETAYNALHSQLLAFRKSAANNAYAEGTKFANEVIRMAISVEMEELLTAYRAGFIDQSGLLNVGVFGAQFRNIKIKTMTEMPEGVHAVIFTERAIQGTFKPSIHTKYIPEAVNQTSYMNEVNTVCGWGIKEVFTQEVTGLIQTAAAPETKLGKAVEKVKEVIKEA